MGWKKAPVTWLIVLLNFLVLLYTVIVGADPQAGLEELMRKDYFIVTQGRVYAQYLREHAAGYPDFLLELGRQSTNGEKDRAEMLGQLAFRDLAFLDQAEDQDYKGDKVAFRYWKEQIGHVRELQSEHPSYTLGLNAEDTSISKWLSYIFVHSGSMHFVGNMLMFLIFGAALELQIGGLAVLVVFLLSGAMAAGVFALLTGVATTPLVGASGAVSGIMTLYCLLNWRKPERYFYWLFLPFRKCMGWVFLPAWVAVLLWALSDLAGYLGTVAELGGVAHTAHLGGESAGILTAVILYLLRKIWPSKAPQEEPVKVPMGVLFPFLGPLS
jgi:membrane associated rhomboid family serine protease